MKTTVYVMAVAVLLAGTAVAPALAQTTPPPAPEGAQTMPSVAGLEPFSAETNFMSLPGYLRWLVYEQSGQWLSMPEAARIVQEQIGSAVR
jgi:hypothetical protein